MTQPRPGLRPYLGPDVDTLILSWHSFDTGGCPQVQHISVTQRFDEHAHEQCYLRAALQAAEGGGPVGMRGDSVSERDFDAAAAVLAKAASIRTSNEAAAMPVIRAHRAPGAGRPLRDLATGALQKEEEETDEPDAPRRSMSAPSAPAATTGEPLQRWRSALQATTSEPVPARGRGADASFPWASAGEPAQTSPPLSSSAGGGALSPRSAGGISRGDFRYAQAVQCVFGVCCCRACRRFYCSNDETCKPFVLLFHCRRLRCEGLEV